MKKLMTAAALLVCMGCGPDPDKPAKGFLDVTLTLNEVKGIQPSYQTVIWLEDDQGRYLQTLYVSEYLSFGGFHDSTICTSWSKKVKWDGTPPAVFDLVTAATPEIGEKTFRFDCTTHGIKPGTYRFNVQTHLLEKYNITYTGRIAIGSKETEQMAQVAYLPNRYAQSESDALSNVHAHYTKK
jgi:hypothetical protein